MSKKFKNILTLKSKEAMDFFLKSEQFHGFELPEYFNFDMDLCKERVRKLNPDIEIFPVSAETGDGMEAWENWLTTETERWIGE